MILFRIIFLCRKLDDIDVQHSLRSVLWNVPDSEHRNEMVELHFGYSDPDIIASDFVC